MPQETTDTGFTGAADTFIPALDGEQEQPVTETLAEETPVPAVDGEVADAETGETEPEVAVDKTPRESLMDKFAQEHGLDLTNDRDKKIAQRMADKELFIQKLRGEQGAKPKNSVDTLMQELLGDGQKDAKPDAVEQPAAETKPPAAGQQGDVGANWRTPSDAYTDLNEAWNKGDLEAVTRIENTMFMRRLAEAGIEDLVQQRIQAALQEQLGDVVPEMRQTVAERRFEAAREFAVEKLSGIEGFEGVAELDKETDGDPIVFNGQEFRNTPMNRILAENPWILEIQVQNADPVKALQATNLRRYQAAYKLYQGSKVPSGQARALVDAGKKMEARSRQDRTRQSLNGGAGAGTSLTPSQGKTGSYVRDELLGLDEPTSFASL